MASVTVPTWNVPPGNGGGNVAQRRLNPFTRVNVCTAVRSSFGSRRMLASSPRLFR